jgi:membrane AbrB-like protein
MLPAILISAVVHATGITELAPPGWLVAFVQIIIGSAAGARFAGVTGRELSETVFQSLLWAAILIGVSAATALIGSRLLGMPFTALLLALAPGGTAEMTIVAYALGIEVAFVVTCQVSRILFVHVSVPLLFRLFNGPPPPQPPPD